jgi:CRISPR-associated RAMP protein (TIGR02581 family)
MHKKQINQAKIVVAISPISPLLIKAGSESGDPSLPDMNFVRSGVRVFVPGSSFKGVIRSYGEKILRTLEIPCCNPLSDSVYSESNEMGSCNKKLEKLKKKDDNFNGVTAYTKSCYACKTFGCTELASRVRFSDGYPENDDNIKIEKRTNVAIDRVLGSVGGGPFDYEIVTKGTFLCEIFITNFQLWQLGLIGLVLRDLDEGYAQMGFAKSRGFGRVRADLDKLEVVYFKKPEEDNKLCGVGEFGEDEYGFLKKDSVNIDKKPAASGFRTKYLWKGHEEVSSLFEAIVGDNNCWNEFMNIKRGE